tara:strand:+ start:190 stop:453 length:264 start_codon:yes stop_codon:yes gene_type:complete
MKTGDLVTLSSYCMKSEAMWTLRNKKPLVGLVVRIEKNPNIRAWTSKNESVYYYVKWMQDGPASRWGNAAYYRNSGYFLRNDLKFVK